MADADDKIAALEVQIMAHHEVLNQLKMNHHTLIARIDQHEDDEQGFHEIVRDRLEQGSVHMAQNAEKLEALEQKITGLLDAWETLVGTGRGLTALGKGVKWLVVTGGAIGIIWHFIQTGHVPK